MSTKSRATLGTTIRALRKSLCLSQENLAAIAGLHWTYIGAVERGECNSSIDNIVRIAHALRVSPSQLLERIK